MAFSIFAKLRAAASTRERLTFFRFLVFFMSVLVRGGKASVLALDAFIGLSPHEIRSPHMQFVNQLTEITLRLKFVNFQRATLCFVAVYRPAVRFLFFRRKEHVNFLTDVRF